MTAAQWKTVRSLFHLVLEQPASERAALVEEMCADLGVRAEVLRLLEAHEEDSFLNHPPLQGIREAIDAVLPGALILRPGMTMAGRYRIVAALGAGGMGEVYRARDNRLDRDVALKILPAAFSDDPAWRQRFEKEARAAASLNHPNVVAVHDFGSQDGVCFIASDLVEGQSLRSVIRRGPVPLRKALEYGIQLAEGISAAHAAGIVHRDLKPENIMIVGSASGSSPRVKLLDFGLAKQVAIPAGSDATMTIKTQPGMVLGTINYMSPEQVQGKEIDARSDIFSFGLVLYEMLTGRHAFAGESTASVMAGILEREAPSLEPEGLNRVVQACLAKSPDNRFQSARDLKRAIEWSVSGSGAAAVVAHTSRKWIPWTVAVVFAALAFLVWLRMWPVANAPTRLALTIVPPSGAPLGTSVGGRTPEISPDGSSVLYAAAGGLWVRRLDSLEAVLVRGSEGINDAAFWSADSTVAVVSTGSALIRIRVPDGAPQVIAKLPGPTRGGSWSDNGTILIASGRHLYRAPASGGETKQVDAPGMKPGRYIFPQFLPGSEDFLFLLDPGDAESGEVYLATLRGGKVLNPILLMRNETAASYTLAGGGRILFVRNDNLYSQKLDLKGRKLTGDADLLQRDVASIPGLSIDRAGFSVSRSGVVAWRPGKAALNQVTVFDRRGKVIGTAGPPSAIESLALSPDETRLLASGWLLEPGQSGRLSLGSGWEWDLWSPDGARLLGRRPDQGLVGERSVSGTGEVHDLAAARGNLEDVSPDGKQVLMMTLGAGVFSVRLQGPEQDRTPNTVVQPGEFVAAGAGFSPDGRWIVYSLGRTGVYVQPFPGPGLRQQIAGASRFPVWRKDGKEIVFADQRGVWSVRVDAAGDGLRFGAPELLFSGLRFPVGNSGASRPLAVSRDGSRFYFPQAAEQPDSGVIHVRLGW